MIRRFAAASLVLTFLCGCAVGNKYEYETTVPTLKLASSGDIAVGVLDQRPYVVSGDKTPDFVGLQRGGFGNPFDVSTASGDALADDFADTVVSSLQRSGVDARAILIALSANKEAAINALRNSGATKSLLITMAEWKSDTYQNVALIYDVTAEVYDGQGGLLAQNHRAAREDLGGSAWNPPNHARAAVPIAFRRVLEGLLEDEEIVKALK